MHEQFQTLLSELVKHSSGVGPEVLGEVLARISSRAPAETSRLQIAAGNPTARRSVDQRPIPQGTVSKAVKALTEVGLLTRGRSPLVSEDGRPLLSLRLGDDFGIAGVVIDSLAGVPVAVSTVLVGLDGVPMTNELRQLLSPGTTNAWEHAAAVAYRQVTALHATENESRIKAKRRVLRLFGVGVNIGAPVSIHQGSPVDAGQVLPLPDASRHLTVPFGDMLRDHFDLADHSGNARISVIVENDVNALAVLAIHDSHYVDADMVVVSVFDQGIGGGLVMDGRLRRGGTGMAMEIGHLAVGFPPGDEPSPAEPLPVAPARAEVGGKTVAGAVVGFSDPCQCGRFGHVDTLATPERIRGELAVSQLTDATDQPLIGPDGVPTEAGRVLKRAGSALGRAIAHVTNTVNPSRIVIYLPTVLARPSDDTAGWAYLAAADREAKTAFSAADSADGLTVQCLPETPVELRALAAKAAAACVLERFIEHALRIDGCQAELKRVGADLAEAAA